MAIAVDLNCDMGEGFGAWSMGDDAALLDIVTSASIACGFHAGDPQRMRQTVAMAVDKGVAIGAHVSYPDRVGFGRRAMQLTAEQITTDTLYQLGALDSMCRAHGDRVRYIKAHGALYHRVMTDRSAADALVQALMLYDPELYLVVMPGSDAERAARAVGISVAAEGFADRAYRADGALVARSEPNAVMTDVDSVVERSCRLLREGVLPAATGGDISLTVDTLCVHSDTPGAVKLARCLRDGLLAADIMLAAFSLP